MLAMVLVDTPPSTAAGIIAAIGTMLTAASVVITALTLFIPLVRRTRELQRTTEQLDRKTTEVHTLVNQQHTDLTNYQAALLEFIRKQGLTAPDDQSRPVSVAPETPPG
jgi:C4-dicarboxylate-specific signal transduction histidine kinase